jgi:hypothetical protein
MQGTNDSLCLFSFFGKKPKNSLMIDWKKEGILTYQK